MEWVRLFTDTIPRIEIHYTKQPYRIQQLHRNCQGMFLHFWHISPRQQTAAQKPFSRQALVQSGIRLFNILKIMRRADDPRRNQTSFPTLRLFFDISQLMPNNFSQNSVHDKKRESLTLLLVTGKKVFAAICSVVYSQDEIIINQTWGMIFEINVHKRSCLN